eukprot:COSAG04_NODE_12532_length_648_cov_0.846995_1_plen_193_part_01
MNELLKATEREVLWTQRGFRLVLQLLGVPLEAASGLEGASAPEREPLLQRGSCSSCCSAESSCCSAESRAAAAPPELVGRSWLLQLLPQLSAGAAGGPEGAAAPRSWWTSCSTKDQLLRTKKWGFLVVSLVDAVLSTLPCVLETRGSGLFKQSTFLKITCGAKELFASPRKIFRIPSPLYIETLRKSADTSPP